MPVFKSSSLTRPSRKQMPIAMIRERDRRFYLFHGQASRIIAMSCRRRDDIAQAALVPGYFSFGPSRRRERCGELVRCNGINLQIRLVPDIFQNGGLHGHMNEMRAGEEVKIAAFLISSRARLK